MSTNPYKPANLDFDRRRGDTVAYTFQFTDENGNAIDDTGYTYKFEGSFKEDPSDPGDYEWELTASGDGTGIVNFLPSSTDVDIVGEVNYDVEWTVSGRTRTVVEGVITFTADISQ